MSQTLGNLASQILFKSQRKFYRNGQQILKYNTFIPSPPKQKDELIVGDKDLYEDIIEPEEVTTISYPELESKGLMIAVRKARGATGQRVGYFLCGIHSREQELGETPKGHRIEFSFYYNCARLVGNNATDNGSLFGYTSWISLNPSQKEKFASAVDEARSILEQYLPYRAERILRKISIPERVLGLNLERKEIVCLPDSRDAQNIGIEGQNGTGKTFLASRIVGLNYWKKGFSCIIANDTKPESEIYPLAWNALENSKFVKLLNKIGEYPSGLPTVPLTPKTRTSEVLKNGYETSINSTLFYMNLDSFTKGSKSWNIHKRASGMVLRNLVYNNDLTLRTEGLCSCKTFEKQEDFINTEFPNKKDFGMRDAILRFLRDVWNFKILDIANEIEAEWEVEFNPEEKRRFTPWNACLMNDLIPSIVTADLKDYLFYPLIYRFIIDDVFKLKEREPYFSNRELTIYVDELPELMKNEGTRETMESKMKTCRSKGIGFLWVAQHDSDVISPIQTVTNYNFYFNMGEKKQVSDVMSRTDMPKYRMSQLKHLKVFECIATSRKDGFICYDENGNRRETDNIESIRMLCFPPLNQHKSPKRAV